MKTKTPVLSINGSDITGLSGIQSDIKTAKDLGAYAVTAITSLTVQNSQGIVQVNEISPELIIGQVRAVYEDCHPKAVKVGMVNDVEAIRQIRAEIVGCPNIVSSPVILSSDGTRLMNEDSVSAFRRQILPETKLLIMKSQDAEILLNHPIHTDEEMIMAATRLHQEGAQWIMLRGNCHTDGRISALLYGADTHHFFTSYNVDGWNRHGINGASSMAIATRLALGDDVESAVNNAHIYLHSQIVYAIDEDGTRIRPKELYNRFVSLIAEHYRKQHEVQFYAEALSITPRYLSQITRMTTNKSPKQIIDDYLLQECKRCLLNTSLSIQEIANQLGFSSQIHFGRFVKHKEGMSPKEIRTNLNYSY